MRKIRMRPNRGSSLLSSAMVGGAGLAKPPDLAAPPGMGVVLLYVTSLQMLMLRFAGARQ